MLPELISHLKLLPLVESCESVWPTRSELQLMAPTYESDLRKLQLLLDCDPSRLVQESEEKDVLDFQVAFIACCYESTAFILSEELAAELHTLRDEFVWDKLMLMTTSEILISRLFNYYRKMLTGEEWYYQFGDLCSFCGFVWDLVHFYQDMSYINRNAMELIERICCRLMHSKRPQLFVKGVMLLEECIHKARGHSLVDYEMVYKELNRQTWRLFEGDERIQKACVVMLTGMLECVRVLEVDRNQLMTLISNFTQFSRADEMVEILLKGLKQSNAVECSMALMDVLLQLLSIDHESLQVVPDASVTEYSLDEMYFPLVIMNEMQKIDLNSTDWWKDIIEQNKGRFHRWTKKLVRLFISEIEKFENFHVAHNQYISYLMLFTFHVGASEPPEQASIIFQQMVTFARKMVNRIDSMISGDKQSTIDSTTLRNCMRLVAANVACVKNYKQFITVAESGDDIDHLSKLQSLRLNQLLKKTRFW
ncbi:uncharacterized protein LOC134226727 [Armigeres subalbatus]|uniref:uncharacterized protein LOC134226727 n=1 Tax=Armigeres subalbatus TaxID=124917 RepID=UPI002ED59507